MSSVYTDRTATTSSSPKLVYKKIGGEKPLPKRPTGFMTERLILVTAMATMAACVVNAVVLASANSHGVGSSVSGFVAWVIFYNFTMPVLSIISQTTLMAIGTTTQTCLLSAAAIAATSALGWLLQLALWATCTASIFTNDGLGICLEPTLLANSIDDHTHQRNMLSVAPPLMLVFGILIIAEYIYHTVCLSRAFKAKRKAQQRQRQAIKSQIEWYQSVDTMPSSRFSEYSETFGRKLLHL